MFKCVHLNIAYVLIHQLVVKIRLHLRLMTAEGNVWNHKEENIKNSSFLRHVCSKTVIEETLADRSGLSKQTTETCTMSGTEGATECCEIRIVTAKLITVSSEDLKLNTQAKPIITRVFHSFNLSSVSVYFLKANSIGNGRTFS